MIASNRQMRDRGGRDDASVVARHGADARHDEPAVTPDGVPDYVQLAYERIDHTDELLARIEDVLVSARRAPDGAGN